MPEITITLEQAQTALDCIDRDMDYSTHDQPDCAALNCASA